VLVTRTLAAPGLLSRQIPTATTARGPARAGSR
jgi:hypothetical protein